MIVTSLTRRSIVCHESGDRVPVNRGKNGRITVSHHNETEVEKEFLKKFLKWNILGPIFRKSRALPLYA